MDNGISVKAGLPDHPDHLDHLDHQKCDQNFILNFILQNFILQATNGMTSPGRTSPMIGVHDGHKHTAPK